jgi:hypothetical protein
VLISKALFVGLMVLSVSTAADPRGSGKEILVLEDLPGGFSQHSLPSFSGSGMNPSPLFGHRSSGGRWGRQAHAELHDGHAGRNPGVRGLPCVSNRTSRLRWRPCGEPPSRIEPIQGWRSKERELPESLELKTTLAQRGKVRIQAEWVERWAVQQRLPIHRFSGLKQATDLGCGRRQHPSRIFGVSQSQVRQFMHHGI